MRDASDSPARTFDVILTWRGRVTLPPEVRENFGLQNGGKILFTLSDDDSAEIAPARVLLRRLTGRRRSRQDDGDPSFNFAQDIGTKSG